MVDFAGAIHKSFDTEQNAIEFMILNRRKIRVDAPKQSPKQSEPAASIHSDEPMIAKAVPIPNVAPVCATYLSPEKDYSPVADMARLIANTNVHKLGFTAPCKDPGCPFTRGDLVAQREHTLNRLYTLNRLIEDHDDANKIYSL